MTEFGSLQDDMREQVQAGLEKRGMSQVDLAIEAEVSRAHLNQFLRGKENISVETFTKLMGALGLRWKLSASGRG